MTKKSQPKSVSEALSVLQSANRLMGVQCFEYKGKILTIFSFVYAMSIAAVYCVSVNHVFDIYLGTRVYKFERITTAFNVYMTIATILVLSFCGCLFSRVYKSIMARIDRVDRTLEQLSSPTNNRRTRAMSVGGIVCFILYELTVNIGNGSFRRISSKTYITLFHLYWQILTFLIRFTFAVLVMCAKDRFQRINDLLREVMAAQQVTPEPKYSKIYSSRLISVLPPRLRSSLEPANSVKSDAILRRSNHVLRTTRQLHLELGKTSRLLCDHFGAQLLMIMTLDMFESTNLLFVLYNRLVSPNVPMESKIGRLILTIPLCLLSFSQLLMMSSSCTSTTLEAARTGEIIHDMDGLIAHPSLREEVTQFALQLIQRPLVFSPLGFLSLNNDLMKAFVGTVTTYSVILIQVGDEWQGQTEKNTTLIL